MNRHRLGPTKIMGILNATHDSFSGDGVINSEKLVERGVQFAQAGADILDVGGESSRPFAEPVTIKEELKRVIPVVKGLSTQLKIPISIATRHPEVAKDAIENGARIVNDISGLSQPSMRHLVAETGAKIVLMHMQGTPQTMQLNPEYANVVDDILFFFQSRIKEAVDAGIQKEQIILDPGIGFGKTLEHNILITRHLDRLHSLGYPVLLGPSRKSFLGEILDLPVDDRLEGTLAAVGASVIAGVDIVRVHDVTATARFLRVFERIVFDRSANA
jgi:dihydropteroate synthase